MENVPEYFHARIRGGEIPDSELSNESPAEPERKEIPTIKHVYGYWKNAFKHRDVYVHVCEAYDFTSDSSGVTYRFERTYLVFSGRHFLSMNEAAAKKWLIAKRINRKLCPAPEAKERHEWLRYELSR